MYYLFYKYKYFYLLNIDKLNKIFDLKKYKYI